MSRVSAIFGQQRFQLQPRLSKIVQSYQQLFLCTQGSLQRFCKHKNTPARGCAIAKQGTRCLTVVARWLFLLFTHPPVSCPTCDLSADAAGSCAVCLAPEVLPYKIILELFLPPCAAIFFPSSPIFSVNTAVVCRCWT